MASMKLIGQRDFSDLPFPVTPIWDATPCLWHSAYPLDVPPGFDAPPLRAEQLLVHAEQVFSRRTAIRYGRTTWSYGQLTERVQLAAANLKRLGLEPGDRALVVLANSPEFVVTWFALFWLGVEIVPASPLLCGHELLRLAKASQAKAVFGLDIRLDPVLEMAREYPVHLLFVTSLAPHLPVQLRLPYQIKCWTERRGKRNGHATMLPFETLYDRSKKPLRKPLLNDPFLPALLQPTGGTTGTPKIAVLAHDNLHANVVQVLAWSGLQAGREVVLSVLPFFHVFGAMISLLAPVAGGATMLLQPRFHPPSIWKLMRRFKPTVIPMVPFMFASLCDEMKRRNRSLDGLNFCMSGASALDPEMKADFEARTGATINEGYGLSEASPVTHVNPPNGDAVSGSIGVPLPNTRARVMDAETGTRELAPGLVGELVIQGPQVMRGYLDNPMETALVLRDGWLYTGDLVRMERNGFFTLVDRKKDVIISGGLNVFPSEVEAVLASHPQVESCAVVGEPDKRYGERVIAHVVLTNGATLDTEALVAYCRKSLASYKIPRTMRVCETLPTNFLGKVRRAALREAA